jgi:hypothetical protein
MDIFLTKFISQKCLGYNPKTNCSQWHMIAEFSDGKVREAYLWLENDTACTGQEAGWVITKTIPTPAASYVQYKNNGGYMSIIMKQKLLKGLKEQKCEWPDCENNAVTLVYDRVTTKVMFCCKDHAYRIINYDFPEYRVKCPNCGCEFGVG